MNKSNILHIKGSNSNMNKFCRNKTKQGRKAKSLIFARTKNKKICLHGLKS